MKNFDGKVLFLDRNDINTDEIIPAKYLTEITKEALKPNLLEDLKLEGFTPGKDTDEAQVIVTRANFGCGSSREHAPWALEVNGINLVIAENFARIFRQNMFNCGMIALEVSKEEIEALFSRFAGKTLHAKTDLEAGKVLFTSDAESYSLSFDLTDFDKDLVKAGGWVNYADKKY